MNNYEDEFIRICRQFWQDVTTLLRDRIIEEVCSGRPSKALQNTFRRWNAEQKKEARKQTRKRVVRKPVGEQIATVENTNTTALSTAEAVALGQLVKTMRESKQLTQGALAKLVNVTRGKISHIETGRVRTKRLYQIALGKLEVV